MHAFTQLFVSRLQHFTCLFGPLTPDGGLPVRISDSSGQRCVILMLDPARLQDNRYCEEQALQARNSLAA